MEVCKVCRLSIAPQEATVLTAFGRQVLVVHRHPCATVVQGGVATIGRVALMAGERALRNRAPKAFAVLQGVRVAARRLSDGQR